MNTSFDEWLASNDYTPFRFQREHGYVYFVIRVKKNDDFDYLYCLNQVFYDSVTRNKDFKYNGLYSRKDGLIYDVSYDLRIVATQCGGRNDADGLQKRGENHLLKLYNADVCKKVEDTIGNDRTRLSVTEIEDPQLISSLDSARRYGAHSRAREIYLEAGAVKKPVYHCKYSKKEWDEDSLLEYIADPLALIERESASYIAQHQEDILYQFLINDLLEAELKAIIANDSLPLHRIKKIIAGINSVGAKTVNVTIKKDGAPFTFKYDAPHLARDCGSSYSTYHMAASDRRLFEKQFGKHADYRPEEITSITYGRKVLYQSE